MNVEARPSAVTFTAGPTASTARINRWDTCWRPGFLRFLGLLGLLRLFRLFGLLRLLGFFGLFGLLGLLGFFWLFGLFWLLGLLGLFGLFWLFGLFRLWRRCRLGRLFDFDALNNLATFATQFVPNFLRITAYYSDRHCICLFIEHPVANFSCPRIFTSRKKRKIESSAIIQNISYCLTAKVKRKRGIKRRRLTRKFAENFLDFLVAAWTLEINFEHHYSFLSHQIKLKQNQTRNLIKLN